MGSIIAVATLIGISFTSVVGYGSIESNSESSPLFNIRINRAIGKKRGDFTCNYDKNKKSTVLCPLKNNRAIIIRKIINNIYKMDDKTYNKFISSIITYTQENNRFKRLNSDQIKMAFYLLKNDELSILVGDNNINTKPATMMPTMCYTCGDFCFLKEFIKIILEKIGEFFDWCFENLWATSAPICIGLTVGCPITFRKLL
jgi:hypothetical protein